MNNLFSIFDPNINFSGLIYPLNWISVVIILFFLPSVFWLVKSQIHIIVIRILKALTLEIEAILGHNTPPGSINILLALFFFILCSNFIGLFPYVFTGSRHLRYTVRLALPLWLGGILWSWIFQYNHIFTHLVPPGTPGALMALIVVIETVSNLIRPGALAVRLAANIVAGHLLLSLLGGATSSIISAVMVMLLLLVVLECAVACIQSYVFTILRTLYLNEVIHNKFNKRILYV